jgi:hypothetical protein
MEQARAAKETLAATLECLPELRGLGIALLDGGGFGVKVNVSVPTAAAIPAEVDGVPVVVEIVGEISAR